MATGTVTLHPLGTNLTEYERVFRSEKNLDTRFEMAVTLLEWHLGAGSHPATVRAWRNKVRAAWAACKATV